MLGAELKKSQPVPAAWEQDDNLDFSGSLTHTKTLLPQGLDTCCAPCLLHHCPALCSFRSGQMSPLDLPGQVVTHTMALAVKSLILYLSISLAGWELPEVRGPVCWGITATQCLAQFLLRLVICHMCRHTCTHVLHCHRHHVLPRSIWGPGLFEATPVPQGPL